MTDDDDWDITYLDGEDLSMMTDDELQDKAYEIKEHLSVAKERARIDLERIDNELDSRGLPKVVKAARSVH